MNQSTSAPAAPVAPARIARQPRVRRAVGIGCLALSLVMCAALGSLAVELRSGPVQLPLPANTALKLGSDDFVLSNYSFQNGTTYFADLNGNGVRNIVELHLLPDTHNFELVLHHATREAQQEKHLVTLPLP